MNRTMNNRLRSVVFALSMFLVTGALPALDTITFETARIHPESEQNRRAVESVFGRAAVLANRRYADLFEVSYGATGGTYHVEAVVTFTGPDPMGALTISKTGAPTEHTFPILGAFTEDKVSYYASGLASLWNAFTDGFDTGEPPQYVDEMPTGIIAPLVVPTNPALTASLAPMSGATLSNGSLVVGMSVAAAQLDEWFRLIGRPAGDQVDANNYSLAGRVFTTPADTIYLIPPTGRAYYRVVDGVPGSRRYMIGNDVSTTPLAVLHDGTIIQKNVSTNDVERFEGRSRTRFSLGTGQMSYVSLIATGPDGNLWAWDQVERRIKIFSPKGILLDSVVAIHRADEFLSPQALVPYPDGSFLLLTQGATGLELKKFRRDGRPEWTLNEIESDFPEALPYNLQPVVGPTGANLYLIDFMSKRVIKLYDRRYADGTDRTIERIIDFNGRIIDSPDQTGIFAEKAKYYEEIGATELAQATWQRLLEVDPYNSDAQAAVERLELEKLVTLVNAQDRKTREILDSLGPESARYQYSTTLRSYEQILARAPGNTELAAQKRRLEETFLERQAGPQERSKPITVASVDIESIFPSLISYYRAHPVGTVTVENTLDEPVFGVVPRFLIPKYMDFV